jgi:lipopolysaccharide/colanic/teichoic acid biosynthesis glycosyltransferase
LLEKRIRLDLVYVTEWSIWLDIQLMARTFWIVLFPQRSAY